MEQLIQQQQRTDDASAPMEWKDPLQMLAKQCDTISGGAEEGRAMGRVRGEGGMETGDGVQQQQAAPAAGKGTTRKSAVVGTNNGTVQQQQQHRKSSGDPHFGDATPKMTTQQKATGNKAKSPNKDLCSSSPSTAAFLHAPPPAAFLHGAAFAPPPAQLAAAMMAGGFFGFPPPPAHRPPPLQQFPPASAIGMPNGQSPPLALNNAMHQLMNAAMQQQMTQQVLQPQTFNSPAGVHLPPSMVLKKMDDPSFNMAMAMLPVGVFPAGGPFLPPNGGPSMSNGGEGLSASPSSTLSIPALLMACASGQLPQGCLACTYRLKDGQLCGCVFPTEEQLFAHYKSAHIGKQSSPNVVSSTTSQGEQSVGTTTLFATSTSSATSAGKKGPAGSPSSSRSTPTQQTSRVSQSGGTETAMVKSHSNPGAMFCNNGTGWSSVGVPLGVCPMGPPMPLQQTGLTAQQWKEAISLTSQPQSGGANANHRFHPYAQPSGKLGLQTGQQGQQTPTFQQMAMAINNLGLMANLGALPAGFFPAGADFVMLAQQQLGLNCPPPVGVPTATPPATSAHHQQSQLAALAAMANSIGSGGRTSTGTTARRQQQTDGVTPLEAVDG
uniref:C2H2-type domain-containing protein n=1 Tax=Globodera rostochiensis TaxID=31243 RepID=A0A914GTE4_GLORO